MATIKQIKTKAIALVMALAMAISSILALVVSSIAYGDSRRRMLPAYPIYGNGPIEIRLYTDYFCPPCRGMKPNVDPLLRDLVQRNKIKLALIDVPMSRQSADYAKEYLNCLHYYSRDLETAITLKTHFNYAAENGFRIESYLHSAGIEHDQPFKDLLSTVLSYYNEKIREDQVRATPTCVICNYPARGSKRSYVGGKQILEALNEIIQR